MTIIQPEELARRMCDTSSQVCKYCGLEQSVSDALLCPKCKQRLIRRVIRSTWSQNDTIAPGTMVGERYRVLALVGGMDNNRFYLASDDCGGIYILKVMDTSFHGFTRYECELLINFDHPYIQNVAEIMYCGDTSIAVMPRLMLARNQAFEHALRSGKAISENLSIISLAIQLCDALSYLHSKGYVHCDVSHRALATLEDGSIRLCSFWQARPIGTIGPLGGDFVAPESHSRGACASETWDVYSLGMLLSQVCTGKSPKTYYPDIPLVRSVNSSISKRIESIIAKATQPDASYRYQNCIEMSDDLKALNKR